MQLRSEAPVDRYADYRLKKISPPFYDHIELEIALFNRYLLGKGPNPIPGEVGVRNMRVIDAAYLSAKSGREEKVN